MASDSSSHFTGLVGVLFGEMGSLLCQTYARLDPWVVPVYVLLCVLAPLAVTDMGWWQALASHGKTATTTTASTTTTSSSTTSTPSTMASDGRGWISNLGRALLRQDGYFWVPKRWFAHFYVTGLLCLALRFFIVCHDGYDLCRTNNETFAGSQPCVLSSFVEHWTASQTTLGVLVTAHLIRRFVECCTVHVWHNSTDAKDKDKSSKSESRMHAAGYLLGLLHYTLLPLALWPIMPSSSSAISSDTAATTFNPSSSSSSSTVDGSLISYFALGCFALWNVWAQYQQHWHHVLLARLRRHLGKPESSVGPEVPRRRQLQSSNDQPSSSLSLYVLPQGGWFQYVSCPHYLAEILVYATWAAMKDVSATATPAIGHDDVQSNHDDDEESRRRLLHRHWILVVWVTTNLTVSALLTHAWYLRHFRDDQHLLRKRYAIFPGWL